MTQTFSQSNSSHQCLALFIAAPSSGQGKTTVTAALARLLTRQGKVVRVFKTGPDYLDPQILQQASQQAVEQLDLWMAGDNYCQQKLFEAAGIADVIIVEGAMGIFDGEPSSADLAARFNIPMILLMDVKGMAQTAAAIAVGIAGYRDDINVVGLIANNCGSQRHEQLITDALPTSLPLLGTFARDESVALPERHLGLVQAFEVYDDLEQRFEAGADSLAASSIESLLDTLPMTEFLAVASGDNDNVVEPLLKDTHIAIAKDEAFSFIYDANTELLKSLGASISYFSPLHDEAMPENADALWLPGGYPELYGAKLAQNTAMLESIRSHVNSNKPVLAECGGFLYCLETLTDLDEQRHNLLAVLNGHGAMRGKRGCQGMQTAILPEGDIRGHAHHRSRSDMLIEPYSHGKRQRHPAPGEAVYREGAITASYLHLFFASNTLAIAQMFNPALITQTNHTSSALTAEVR